MKEIQVLMLGGKRCGKTTVLSSMYGAANVSLAGTELFLSADPATQMELERARQVIVQKMKQFEEPLTSCEVDDNATNAARAYSFSIKRKGVGAANVTGIPFRIIDIPGEWLTNENAAKVKTLVKDCQVIIIAIDTPYLFAKMTDKGYGQYHEKYNKSIEITNFFKNTLTSDDLKGRMVLFVPIKCERYYHLDRSSHLKQYGRRYMSEVAAAVGEGYRDLIMYLRSTDKLVNSCTIAITPILSAGGIDFISFREDEETGKMVSYYQQPEFLDSSELGYNPKFCEQPMIYTLAHILLQTTIEGQRNPMYAPGNVGMNPDQVKTALNTMRHKMKRNSGLIAQDDGYLFIQNPYNL